LIKKFEGPDAGVNWTAYQTLMRHLGDELPQGWSYANNIQLPFERVFLASHIRDDLDWKLNSAWPAENGLRVNMVQNEKDERGYMKTVGSLQKILSGNSMIFLSPEVGH